MSGRSEATQALVRRAGAGLCRLSHAAALAGALALAPLAAAQAPPAPIFDIQRFSVEGNTLLDAVRIDAVLADHAGKALSVVWSHHFALVYGEDPRRVAQIYAPTETKSTGWRVQDAAVVGIEITNG